MIFSFFNKNIWATAAGNILVLVALVALAGVLPSEAQASRHQTGASIIIPPAPAPATTSATPAPAPSGGLAKRTETLTAPPSGLNCTLFTIGATAWDHCLALAGYYIFFVPASLMMFFAGFIFDAAMTFHLSGYLVNLPFVTDAWIVLRDTANLGFILTLIYTSVSMILGFTTDKKFLVNLVIVALLLNFSAFFTKVVIDASNIFALEFYNAVGAPERATVSGVEIPQHSLSSVFITGFDPERLTGTASYESWSDQGRSAIPLFFIFITAAVVTFFASSIMVRVAFLFIGLAIDFAYLVIVSPIAFISYILPGFSYFGKWFGELKDRALQAPIFLMGMYVIAQLIQGDFIKTIFSGATAGTTTDYVSILTNTIIVFAVLYFALDKLLSITKGYSGTAGEWIGKNKTIQGFAGKFGFAGVPALAGRAVRHDVGRVASRAAETGLVKGFASRFPGAGGALIGALDKVRGEKYRKEREEEVKKLAKFGARIAGVSDRDKLKINRMREDRAAFIARNISQQGGILTAAQQKTLRSMEQEEKKIEKEQAEAAEARKKRIAQSYGSPGLIGRAGQIITGTTRAEREAAIKIREGEKEDPAVKKIKELLKAAEKAEKEGGAPPTAPPPPAGATG